MIEVETNTKQHEAVLEIDSNIHRLVQNIELLNYVNPLNSEKEKQNFFASKYNYEPRFHYLKQKFNGFKLQRLLFSQRLERIEDESIRKLYEDIIYYYSGMVECIQAIGTGKHFYYNCLRTFGSPREREVQNARFILHIKDDVEGEEAVKKYSVAEAQQYFEDYAKDFDFGLNIRTSRRMAAEAMVSNKERALILKKGSLFSLSQLKILANHEIGVHLATTFNAIEQPLKIFSNGFPNNVETQEGLAVYSEYLGNALTMRRLKELAYRVIAVNSLVKGNNFSGTFDMLLNRFKLSRDQAFNITLRVYRGGGFTKDHLYLKGLKKVYDYAKAGKDIRVLLAGKVCTEYSGAVEKLQEIGLALPSNGFVSHLSKNENTNKRLDFILNNLK